MFPEVTTWITNVSSLVQIVGVGIFLISFPLGGIILMTAAGSERRQELGKNALICAAVGLFVILISSVIQMIIARIAGVSLPALPTPVPTPLLTPVPSLTPTHTPGP